MYSDDFSFNAGGFDSFHQHSNMHAVAESGYDYYDSREDSNVFTAAATGAPSFDVTASNSCVGFTLLANANNLRNSTSESENVHTAARSTVHESRSDEQSEIDAFCDYYGIASSSTPAEVPAGWGTLTVREIAEYKSREVMYTIGLDYAGESDKFGFVWPTREELKSLNSKQFAAITRTYTHFIRCVAFAYQQYAPSARM